MERGTYANARDAVSALHGRRAKPLRDYRLLRQSSRDFETVIWPRNLRKCRRWLEFSDKRDGPWRDKEREAKGMRERRVGGAKVGRGGEGDTTHRRMWKEAEETMVTVIIFLSRPVTARPTAGNGVRALRFSRIN